MVFVLFAAALVVLDLLRLLSARVAFPGAGLSLLVGATSTVLSARRVSRISVQMGAAALVGKKAVVRTPLTPQGFVFIQGERWAAEIDEGSCEPGEHVLIIGVEGFRLKVRKEPRGAP